jgi:O-antigen/teichoic acid export membrane protein
VGGLLALGAALIAKAVEPGYHVIGLLMLSTVAAKMVVCIPSNANSAAENWRANFIGTALNCLVTVSMVNVSLRAGWGLTGVAASMTAGMVLELLVKMVLVLRLLTRVPGAVLPADLRKRMVRFSGQGFVLLILQIVVWDRSDLVFLRILDKDKSQVTFFALAFNLIDKILYLPQAFSQVVGASVMAEYGRNPSTLHRFVSTALKYGLLVSVPVMVGTAAISSSLIRVSYGIKYLPIIPVLAIGALLATVKPLLGPLQSLFQAKEKQGFLIKWTIGCAVVNIVLDITLIPLAGARGAMAANGLAQVLAIAGIAIMARRKFSVRVDPGVMVKIATAGAMMAAVVWSVQQVGAPLWVELACGIPLGALVYVLALRLLRVLDQSDGPRLQHLAGRVPGPPGRLAASCVAGMVHKTSVGT